TSLTRCSSSATLVLEVNRALTSAPSMYPRDVRMRGVLIVCQIPGTLLTVQTAIATAITASVTAKIVLPNTSQSYQRLTRGCSTGTASPSHWGTSLPRNVPIRTSSARTVISKTAARTEQKKRQILSTTMSSGVREGEPVVAESCAMSG